MSDMTVWDIAILVPLALMLSMVALWLMGRTAPTAATDETGKQETVFLFRGGILVDHDAANLLLPDAREAETDWARFRRWMGFRFGNLPHGYEDLTDGESLRLLSDGAAQLHLSRQNETVRAVLRDDPPADAAARHAQACHHHDLQSQSLAAQSAPLPVWIMDAVGTVIWQNDSARAIAPRHAARLTGPPDDLPDLGGTLRTRLTLTGEGGAADQSYDLHVTRTESGTIHYAFDITRLIRAETAQRDFVQTLSKTFADLTAGLVVFDRAKTLAVFNPALTDLTSLSPEFLSARPSLFGFFDALRDRMVMPEPKNYASWRGQIADMVKSATGGLYHEVWTLPSGQTYRVTGRPHPDGAVAFMFEDISLEVSVTRRHRLQMDLHQSVIDRLEDGIAVLAQDGRLLFCNTTFGEMLGIAPDVTFAEMRLHDVISACSARYPDPGLWPEIEDRITTRRLVATLHDSAGPPGQKGADVRVVPLGRGQFMLCLKSRESASTGAVGLPAR